MSNFVSLLVLVVGPVLLGGIIAYGMMQMRLYSSAKHHRDALTGELYGKDKR